MRNRIGYAIAMAWLLQTVAWVFIEESAQSSGEMHSRAPAAKAKELVMWVAKIPGFDLEESWQGLEQLS